MITAPKPRHLAKLPPKSYKVAQGDLIGTPMVINGKEVPAGTIYIDDKRLGIEAGHMGIGIDSKPYRDFIKAQIEQLKNENHANAKMQERFNKVKKNNATVKQLTEKNQLTADELEDLVDLFITDKEHKKIHGKRTNVGLGGLIFQDYLKHAHIKESDNHFVLMAKLSQEHDAQGNVVLDEHGQPKPLNDVYMIKGDNILTLGRAGPNLDRVRQTERREWGHLLSRKNLTRTLGLSGLAYAAIGWGWRANIMRETSPLSASTDAVVENVANKMAELRGIRSQLIDTVEGTFENGDPKIVPIVKWSTGFGDLSGKIAGNESSWDSVVVKFKNKHPVKIDDEGNTIIVQVDREGNKSYLKTSPNGHETNCAQEEYDAAYQVSDDSILGLGEALVGMVSMGDRDKFGKQGQNMGIMPLNPPQGQYTHQLYGIDYGKSYESDNKLVGTLRDDFSFDNPSSGREKMVNYSIMYDNPLRNKMKGVYMLGVLRGRINNQRKEEIAKQYEAAGDLIFAAKLRNYPTSLEHELIEKLAPEGPGQVEAIKQALKKNGDLYLIAIEQMKYRELAKDKSLSKSARKNYQAFADRLDIVYKRALTNDDIVLHKFERRLQLNPEQIDLLEKFEKITARKAHDTTPDGKVKMNHLRVENEDRTEWQIDLNEDGTFNLICEETDRAHLQSVRDKLNELAAQPNIQANPTLLSLIQQAVAHQPAPKIENITREQLAMMNHSITERQAAEIHGLKPMILFKPEAQSMAPRAEQSRTPQPQPPTHRQRSATTPQFSQHREAVEDVLASNPRESHDLGSSLGSDYSSASFGSEVVGSVSSDEAFTPASFEEDSMLEPLAADTQPLFKSVTGAVEVTHPSDTALSKKDLRQRFQAMETVLTTHFEAQSWQVTNKTPTSVTLTDNQDAHKAVQVEHQDNKTVFKQTGGAHKQMIEAVQAITNMDQFKDNHRCIIQAKSEIAAANLLQKLHKNGFDVKQVSAIHIKGKPMDDFQRDLYLANAQGKEGHKVRRNLGG